MLFFYNGFLISMFSNGLISRSPMLAKHLDAQSVTLIPVHCESMSRRSMGRISMPTRSTREKPFAVTESKMKMDTAAQEIMEETQGKVKEEEDEDNDTLW